MYCDVQLNPDWLREILWTHGMYHRFLVLRMLQRCLVTSVIGQHAGTKLNEAWLWLSAKDWFDHCVSKVNCAGFSNASQFGGFQGPWSASIPWKSLFGRLNLLMFELSKVLVDCFPRLPATPHVFQVEGLPSARLHSPNDVFCEASWKRGWLPFSWHLTM